MNKRKREILIVCVTAVFIIAALLFMFGRNISNKSSDVRKSDSTLMPEATGTTNEIKNGAVVEQDFICTTETVSGIGIVFTRVAYREDIDITLELSDGNSVLASNSYKCAQIEDQHRTYISPSSGLSGMKNKKLTIRIYPENNEDTGLMIMMDKNSAATFRFNNKTIKGSLCFSVTE